MKHTKSDVMVTIEVVPQSVTRVDYTGNFQDIRGQRGIKLRTDGNPGFFTPAAARKLAGELLAAANKLDPKGNNESYVRNCYIEPKEGERGLIVEFDEDNSVTVRLDGYAIIPRDRYAIIPKEEYDVYLSWKTGRE